MFRLPLFVLLIVGLAAGLACASPAPLGQASVGLDRSAPSPQRFPTLEAAVEAAFDDARRSDGPDGRARLRLGTIRRVGDGFTWSAPVASRASVWSRAPMRVRLALAAEDVAVYAVHPRSGRPEVDRANETPSRSERALVESWERPLFVLTPSRRIVRLEVESDGRALVRREARLTGR